MPRNTGPRTARYVNTSIGTQILKYIFQSGLKDSLKNDFGQTDVIATINVENAIYKANNFKPSRGQKFEGAALGYEGSFCSDDKVKSLRDSGVQVTRKSYSKYALKGRAGATLYYGTINGLKIGYRVNDNTLPTDFTSATGLTLADQNDIVIMGASFPTLGQALYTDPASGLVSSYACDPSKYNDLSGNWSQGKPPLFTQADLVTLLGI